MIVAILILVDFKADPLNIIKAKTVVFFAFIGWFLFEALVVPTYVSVTFSQAEYDYGVFCLFLSLVGFIVGYQLFLPWRGIYGVAGRLRILEQPEYLWKVTLIAAVIGFTPVIYYGGVDVLNTVRGFLGIRTSWGGGISRSQYGGFRDAMLMFELFALSLSGLATVYVLRSDQPLPKRMFALAIVLYSCLRAYGSGTRSAILIAVIPILLAIAWQFSPEIRRKLMMFSLPLGFLVYEFSIAMVAGRNQGVLEWGADVSYVGYEMFRELLYIIRTFPEQVDYLWGQSYFAEIVNPIPRFLWEEKPARFGVFYADLVAPEMSGTGFTASYGLIGEMYMNFGVLGIPVLSIVGGWMCRSWDEMFHLAVDSISVMTFFAMGLGVIFILGRSFSFPEFYQMIFLYFAIYFTTRHYNSGQPNSV